MNPSRLAIPLPALILGLAGPLAAQSQATWYAAYEDGLGFQAKGKSAAALAAFQRAAELRPQPGNRVLTYGMNFLDAYHPWLKIAQCAMAVKDLDTAEEALKRSTSYGKEPAAERQALQQKLAALRAPAPVVAPAPTQVPAPAPTQPQLLPQPSATQPNAAQPSGVGQPGGAAPSGSQIKLAPGVPDTKKPTAPVATGPAAQPVVTSAPSVIVSPQTELPAVDPNAVQQVPSRKPWWIGLGSLFLAMVGVGGWAFSRRKRSEIGVPSSDHLATQRLGDQDGTRLLSSKAGNSQAGTVALVKPGLTQQGKLRMGHYTLEKVLGKGACGTTYMGVRDENGLEVAIKVPHGHMLEDPEFLARFHQEAALGARLIHDKIVRIIDPGPLEGTPWLAMELVRGETLDHYIKAKGRLELKEALSIALDIAEAIAYAHAQGVVHRDLKPANIMVGEKGAQVLDFGIARLTDGVGMTATQVFIGTPLYASPESIIHSRVGPGADRYALGIMLFEFFSGRLPFVGSTTFATLQMHQIEPLPDLAALVPGLDPRLLRLVNRLTEKKPENRPEDGEVITLLKQVYESL